MVSKGPSGKNSEYLFQLEEALNSLSAESGDEHISDLASRCRAIAARESISAGMQVTEKRAEDAATGSARPKVSRLLHCSFLHRQTAAVRSYRRMYCCLQIQCSRNERTETGNISPLSTRAKKSKRSAMVGCAHRLLSLRQYSCKKA
jgi:cation transport regulator ChaC